MSCLSEIYKCIRIGSHLSSKTRILCGVPQGSVGAWFIYLPRTVRLLMTLSWREHDLNFLLYADATRLQNALDRLRCYLHDVDARLHRNRIILNGSKTAVVVFSTKQKLSLANNIHVIVGSCLVCPVPVTKNLGIVYDSTRTLQTT